MYSLLSRPPLLSACAKEWHVVRVAGRRASEQRHSNSCSRFEIAVTLYTVHCLSVSAVRVVDLPVCTYIIMGLPFCSSSSSSVSID